MKPTTTLWGTTATGDEIKLFRLTNASGASIELTNLGAAWVSALVPDVDGRLADVLLGYNDVHGYINDTCYMGSTIGRFANRISNASFTLGGKCYLLEQNDGQNSNHGGISGLHRKVWAWEETDEGVRFFFNSPDGDGGYPGNVKLCVEYSFTNQCVLTIRYRGITDAPTYLNLTNHAYFNLSGTCGTVFNHQLCIPATKILETSSDFIPTGNYIKVKGTPFDFTTLRSIGERFSEENEQLRWNRGYNHCYILSEEHPRCMKPAATLYDSVSGRHLTVETTLPGVLLYTAGFIEADVPGKYGELLKPHTGVCLETQFFPDTPSHANFPSCLLSPGEIYDHVTRFAFSAR